MATTAAHQHTLDTLIFTAGSMTLTLVVRISITGDTCGRPTLLGALMHCTSTAARNLLERHRQSMRVDPDYRATAERFARAMVARREEWS